MDCLVTLRTVSPTNKDPNAAPNGVHALFKRVRWECLPSVGDEISHVGNTMNLARVTGLTFIAHQAGEGDLLQPGMVRVYAEPSDGRNMAVEELEDAMQNHGWSDAPPDAGAPAFYAF
jgi:hypothetical protein